MANSQIVSIIQFFFCFVLGLFFFLLWIPKRASTDTQINLLAILTIILPVEVLEVFWFLPALKLEKPQFHSGFAQNLRQAGGEVRDVGHHHYHARLDLKNSQVLTWSKCKTNQRKK